MEILVHVCVFASDALGTLARTIGQEHFRHLSVECVELGKVYTHTNIFICTFANVQLMLIIDSFNSSELDAV